MIFYCSLDELVVFKTRERGSIQELSKDPYTSEIKLIVPTPPERPHCLPLLASGLFVMSRSVDTEVPNMQENAQGWELPWFHMKIHDGQWEGMHKQRWALEKSPEELQQALCTTNLGFHQDGHRERHAKMSFYLISPPFSFSHNSVSHTVRPQCFLHFSFQ